MQASSTEDDLGMSESLNEVNLEFLRSLNASINMLSEKIFKLVEKINDIESEIVELKMDLASNVEEKLNKMESEIYELKLKMDSTSDVEHIPTDTILIIGIGVALVMVYRGLHLLKNIF